VELYWTTSSGAEFIGAVVQLSLAIEQMHSLTERLLGAHEARMTLSVSELADSREQVELWREQIELLRVRVTSFTVPPPNRPH